MVALKDFAYTGHFGQLQLAKPGKFPVLFNN
jgi:hypothetical protein